MAITAQASNATLTLNISGSFDFKAQQEFRNAYKNVDGEIKSYIVNLSATEYLDSSALGMMLMLREHAGGDSADIEIRGSNDEVGRILKIARFDKMFRIA